jgi:hypothetical protein
LLRAFTHVRHYGPVRLAHERINSPMLRSFQLLRWQHAFLIALWSRRHVPKRDRPLVVRCSKRASVRAFELSAC